MTLNQPEPAALKKMKQQTINIFIEQFSLSIKDNFI